MKRHLTSFSPAPHPTRRQFIQQISAAALAGTVASAAEKPAAKLKSFVGSNSFGWTQYARRDKKPFDIAETMSVLRDLGYDYLETNMDFAHPDSVTTLADQVKHPRSKLRGIDQNNPSCN